MLGVLDTGGLALLGSFLFFSLFLKNAVRFANCLLKKFADLGKIWMEAVSQGAREGLNTELDLEKPAQPTYGTFFATYGTFGNLWHFLARV